MAARLALAVKAATEPVAQLTKVEVMAALAETAERAEQVAEQQAATVARQLAWLWSAAPTCWDRVRRITLDRQANPAQADQAAPTS